MAESTIDVDKTNPENQEINSEMSSNERLEGTLSEISNTMGQMADLMARMYSKFEEADSIPTGSRTSRTKGEKRERSRDNSPSGESEPSEGTEDSGNKRMRLSEDGQDRLSIHAHDDDDDDVLDLLNEHPSTVNDHPSKEENLLQDLAKSFEEDDATGSEIQTGLADLANKRWAGKKLSSEKL